MRIRPLPIALALAGLILATPLHAEEQGFVDTLPADTLAYLAIPDVQAASNALDNSDLGRMLADPEVKAFVDTLMAGFEDPLGEMKAEFKKNTGLELDDVLSIVVREAGVAVLDFDVEQMTLESKQHRAYVDLISLETAIQSYRADTGKSPGKLDDLITNPGLDSWYGPYLWEGSVPRDPWGNAYQLSATAAAMTLVCFGADGKPGGVGADTDITSKKRPARTIPVSVVGYARVMEASVPIVHQAIDALLKKNVPAEKLNVVQERRPGGWKWWNIETPDGLLALAAQGNRFFFATNDRAMSFAKGAFEQAPEKPLTKTPGFAEFQARLATGAPMFTSFVDVPSILAKIPAPQEQVKQLLDDLGIFGVEQVGFSFGLNDGQFTGRMAMQAPAPRKGLVKLLDFGSPAAEAAKLATRVPAHASTLAVMNVELAGWWDLGMQLFKTFGPDKHEEFQKGLADFETELGFTVRGDLLGGLGSTIAGYAAYPEGGALMEQTVNYWHLEDPARFEKILTAIVDKGFFEVKELDYRGQTIRYLASPVGQLGDNPFEDEPDFGEIADGVGLMMGMSLSGYSFYVNEGWLVFSNLMQALKDDLDWQHSRSRGLAAQEAFQQAAARAPQGSPMFLYGSGQGTLDLLYNSGLPLLQLLEGIARRAGVSIDVALLPRAEKLSQHLLPSVSYAAADEGGITYQLQLGGMGGTATVAAVVAVVAIGAAITIPSVARAKSAANESMAIATLHQLHAAQAVYQAEKGEYAATLAELHQHGMIEESLSGSRGGYVFAMSRTSPDSFTAEAHPVDPGSSGDRVFRLTESGAIEFKWDLDDDKEEWKSLDK